MRNFLPRPVAQQSGRQVSESRRRLAPVGGWNARDPKDSMRPDEAIELVNLFPTAGKVTTRPGTVLHCDAGTSQPISRMYEFEYGANHRLVAASAGLLLDVTSSNPRVLGGGFASDYWSGATLSGRLLLANGTDLMQSFDGSTLSPAAFTGISTDELSFVHVHKSRVFAIQRGTQTFWFGDPQAIAGPLSDFDLSLVGSFGGDLLTAMTISRDGGLNGPDDFLIFIFTSGDAIIYQGTDPGDPEAWSQVGHFKVGRPLGRFAGMEYGDDVLVLTERGYESVKASIPFGDITSKAKILSSQIQDAVASAVKRNRSNDAWHAAAYQSKEMLVINVPTSDGTKTEQHVMNLTTKKWARFLDINATSWCGFGGSMFLGTIDGRVLWFDGAPSDLGEPIKCWALTAWDYLDDATRVKHHKLQRLVFESEQMPDVRISIGTDFQYTPTGGRVTFVTNPVVAYWDEAYWDTDQFGPDTEVVQGWIKCPGIGVASSCRVFIVAKDAAVSWNGIYYVFERGSYI